MSKISEVLRERSKTTPPAEARTIPRKRDAGHGAGRQAAREHFAQEVRPLPGTKARPGKRFRVELDGYAPLELECCDRYEATRLAAIRWDVVWRSTARNMDVTELRD